MGCCYRLQYSKYLSLFTYRRLWTSYANQNRHSLVKSSYTYLIDKAKENQSLMHREQFAVALKDYLSLEKYRRGHVNFIKEGLIRMDEFGLQKDLLTYNRLLDLFPKDRFKNKTLFDALWPKPHPQIDLALDILQKMEDHGVRPDYTTYSLLCEIFGRVSFPVQKCTRIAVWFDKYENIDPYRIQGDLPTDPYALSRMALQRIAGDGSHLREVMVPESEEDSFILGASSKQQVDVLQSISSLDSSNILYVNGPHRLWLQRLPLFYYSLKLFPYKDNKTETTEFIKEYSDDTILGVCMCKPPTQECLTLWLQDLSEEYPYLKDVPVVYDVTVLDDLIGTYHKPKTITSSTLSYQLKS